MWIQWMLAFYCFSSIVTECVSRVVQASMIEVLGKCYLIFYTCRVIADELQVSGLRCDVGALLWIKIDTA